MAKFTEIEKGNHYDLLLSQFGYEKRETGKWKKKLIDTGYGFPEEKITCPFCGTKKEGEWAYCPNCGAKLE